MTVRRAVLTMLILIVANTAAINAIETAPLTFPGADSYVFSKGKIDAQSLRLHVVKPKDWRASGKRPALIFFFGGAWTRGTPANSIGWAKLAASWGMIGIAPDYRTAERFHTTPLESVTDARAAYAWIRAHAAELGIDPERIVVGGNSAGAHVAIWTAIEKAANSPDIAAAEKPAALILLSAPVDLSDPRLALRFGSKISAASPLQHLDAKMPPVIMIHGDADQTVPYKTVTAFPEKLKAAGNICEFITVPGGAHNFSSNDGWKEKSRDLIHAFLSDQKILLAETPRPEITKPEIEKPELQKITIEQTAAAPFQPSLNPKL